MEKHTLLIEKAYDDFSDAIFRHCYLRLMERERAKDIMQDTFIRAFQYLQKGNDVQNMRALLYRIANNLIIDFVRKAKEQSLDALQEAGYDPTGSDGEHFGKTVDGAAVLATLSKLHPDDRDIIVMRFVDEMKPQEIAEILGIAPNTVSVRIHRALKELKPFLSPT